MCLSRNETIDDMTQFDDRQMMQAEGKKVTAVKVKQAR